MSRNLPNARVSDHPSIKGLQQQAYGLGNIATRNSGGSIELAFMRGYQAGYEQAIKDDTAGELKKANSTRSGRSQ